MILHAWLLCLVSSRDWNGLRNDFKWQNWGDGIRILEENLSPFPKCDSCISQVPWGGLTASTKSRISSGLERRGGFGGIHYSTTLRQVVFPFG